MTKPQIKVALIRSDLKIGWEKWMGIITRGVKEDAAKVRQMQ